MNTIIEGFREVEIVPVKITLVLLLYTCSCIGSYISLLIVRVEVDIGVFGMQKDYITY